MTGSAGHPPAERVDGHPHEGLTGVGDGVFLQCLSVGTGVGGIGVRVGGGTGVLVKVGGRGTVVVAVGGMRGVNVSVPGTLGVQVAVGGSPIVAVAEPGTRLVGLAVCGTKLVELAVAVRRGVGCVPVSVTVGVPAVMKTVPPTSA
jgi:hypothetical protein